MPKDQDAAVVVETDPDGRYHRYKEKLGEGSFKSVYKAFDSEMGIEVAWNQVKIKGRLYGDAKERFMEEVILLQKLRHKSIIECYHYWEDEEQEHVNFITELMTSGTLKSFVKTKKVNLRIIRKWARQILSALAYLHTDFDKPIIHRDLKCDNIFINGNLGEVKLGDLGLSTMLTETHAQSVIGTPEFMAPELYEEQYTEKVDIYAFGMCILEIFTNEYPYAECSNAAQIYKKVTKGLPPSSLEKMENIAVKHFIEQCLTSEPDRPTARTLLQHDLLMEEDLGPPPVVVSKEGALSEDKKELAVQPAQGEAQGPAKVPEEGKGAGPEILWAEMGALEEADAGPETGKISIQAKINGKNKMIEFDFDTGKDSVQEVAMELLEQIEADSAVLPDFEGVIQNAVNIFLHKQQQQLDGHQQNENLRPAESQADPPTNPVQQSTSPSSDGALAGTPLAGTPTASPPASSGTQLPPADLDKAGARVNPTSTQEATVANARKDTATGSAVPTQAPLQPPQAQPQPLATNVQAVQEQGSGAVRSTNGGGGAAPLRPADGVGGLEPAGGVPSGASKAKEEVGAGGGRHGQAGGEVQGSSAQQRTQAEAASAGREARPPPASGEVKSYSDAVAQPGSGQGVSVGNPRAGASTGTSAGELPAEGGVKAAVKGSSVAANPAPTAAAPTAPAAPTAVNSTTTQREGAGASGAGPQAAPAAAGPTAKSEMISTKLVCPVEPFGQSVLSVVPEGSKSEFDKRVKELELVYKKKVKEAQEQFLLSVAQVAEAHGGRLMTSSATNASAASASSTAGGAAAAAAAAGARNVGAEASAPDARSAPARPPSQAAAVPAVTKPAIPQPSGTKPVSPVQASRAADPTVANTRNPAGQVPGSGGDGQPK